MQPTLSAIYNRNGNVKQNHILVSKFGFVLSVLLQLAMTAMLDWTSLRCNICPPSDKKLLNFLKFLMGSFGEQVDSGTRAASVSSPSFHL